MSSKDNLKAAFTGESMANRTYLAFAKKADDEGYPQIAKLFRAAAAAETVHWSEGICIDYKEILAVYEAGPEAVVELVTRLFGIIEQQALLNYRVDCG